MDYILAEDVQGDLRIMVDKIRQALEVYKVWLLRLVFELSNCEQQVQILESIQNYNMVCDVRVVF